jgi:hypothetical protein
LDAEVERTQEDSQKTEAPTPDKEVLPSNLTKESQQCEVTMPKEDKNQNGKRNNEMKIIGKKSRNISKKREKIEKLQKGPEGTLKREKLQNKNFVGISERCHMALRHGEEMYLLRKI